LRRVRRPQSLAELGFAEPDANGRVSVRKTTASAAAAVRAPVLPAQVRILGLDPGSLRTGYAVVETHSARVAYLVSGTIRTEGSTLAERLQEIFIAVERLTSDFRPDEVAIEGVFMHRNADSALKLGQARGAALSATFAARPRVYEYAPRAVKLAVVGTGSAQKEQVQLMVRRLLNISGPLAADAADALAIALCHAHSRKVHGLAAVAGLLR
jgi:crossover junction endodeoxyribonuclease RuvC